MLAYNCWVPNQKALKLVLSVINKIDPLPLGFTLNGTEPFSNSSCSSEI